MNYLIRQASHFSRPQKKSFYLIKLIFSEKRLDNRIVLEMMKKVTKKCFSDKKKIFLLDNYWKRII